jgi:glycosyltransferase involved in cell wall biosynthesis
MIEDIERLPHRDIGLVHDYLLVLRGAERTFAAIADMWPSSPVYTTLYDAGATEQRFAGHPVATSFLQRAHVGQGSFRRLLPLFPRAAEKLPVQAHRLIVSSSSAFAHGVRPGPDAVHVCYCHTPFRYAWFERQRALAEVPAQFRPALSLSLSGIRRWDVKASQRVTHYVANSRNTQRRILELYGRESNVVHPPVEVDRFSCGEPEDYFLTVSELVPHKRVEIAAEAASAAKKKLKVIGGGPEFERLRARYGKTVEFLGRVGDQELRRLYRGAIGVVVPNVEEFGIVAVEAQASGKPVIAARAGGSTETVIEDVTGCFVPPGDAPALERALRRFDPADYEPATIQRHAQTFSADAFRAKMREEIRIAAEANDSA